MKSIHIFLVEDNEGDIMLTMEALEEAKINNHVSIARDGQEAIDFIASKKENRHDLPDLILLDMNLPKKNGLEVLSFVKENSNTRHIPVVLLTTSSSENDVRLAYQNYANCYITKPITGDDFYKMISQIQNFWFDIVKLPPKL